MLFCELLVFTNIPLGTFRGGSFPSETGLFQKCWKQILWLVGGQVLASLVTSNFAICFLGIFSGCCFVNCCFLQTESLGTLEEEVLCLRLDSFKTAGNNFCGRSEDKFWRYLSLLLRHFCSGYYCTLAPKAIWGQTLFEVTFEFSNSKYWNFFYTFYQNECQKKS